MEPFDCELLRNVVPAQPVNALSSLAFVAAGYALWMRGRRDVALLAALTGAGSVWFHASPGGAASWAHDITLYGLVALCAIELWQRIAQRRPPVLASTVFFAGLVFWSIGRTGSPFCNPETLMQWHAVWHTLAASAVVILFTPETVTADG